MINFDLVGRLKMGQESDKFKPYQERTFDSGWTNRTLLINALCGDNRHMLQIQGGTFPNKKDYKIITFGPNTVDESGNRVPGERVEIPWTDRLSQASIEKVAEFRKYIVDLEKQGRRRLLEQFAQRIHEGQSLSDEDLASVGLTEESEVAPALEKSQKLRKEFISQWDQAEYMKKVLTSDKYKDKKFFVRGIVDCQWSEQKGQWYKNMVPQRIYLAPDDAEEYSHGSTTLYFSSDAVDDQSLEEKHKYYVKAYTMEYNSDRKKNIPCEFQLVIPDKIPHKEGIDDGKDGIRAAHEANKFKIEDDKVREYGVEFDLLNGSQKVEITPEMLTDDQKEELDLGIITMDEIRRDLGGSVYGDRVIENRYIGCSRGYSSGVKDTAYTKDDLVIPPIEKPDEDGLFDEEFADDDDL